MSDLNLLKELLETAVNASGRDNLSVFDYDQDDVQGLIVAESGDHDFQIVIIPEVRNEVQKTIAGDRLAPVTFYNIHVPKYDEGDESVGMQGYYYTDPEEGYTWSFKSATDTAIKALSWLVEYEISLQVNNAAEYLYYQEQQRYYNEEV